MISAITINVESIWQIDNSYASRTSVRVTDWLLFILVLWLEKKTPKGYNTSTTNNNINNNMETKGRVTSYVSRYHRTTRYYHLINNHTDALAHAEAVAACSFSAWLIASISRSRFHKAKPPPPPLAVAMSRSALIQLKNGFAPFSTKSTLFSLPRPVL